MPVYIAMVRGINVGVVKRISMPELVAVGKALGFGDVKSYIQSGNLVFSYSGKAHGASKMLADAIEKRFGQRIEVIVRTGREMGKVVGKRPFEEDGLYVVFLSEAPRIFPADEIDKSKALKEKYRLAGKEVYLFCPEGYGKTKLSNTFFERRLGIAATTRNWNTVSTLLEMAREAEAAQH